MRRNGCGVILLGAFCWISAPTFSISASGVVPRFDSAACPFVTPQGLNVQCGYLTVPENRTKPTKQTVRLAVGIFKAAHKTANDPIVFLDGGPGGAALKAMVAVGALDSFDLMTFGRDLIIIDQRGTGYSEPSLACPGYSDVIYAHSSDGITSIGANNDLTTALQTCHDTLIKNGVDPSDFSTAESAADVDALRLTLGYAKWNVYGVSYGTRLAHAVFLALPQQLTHRI